MRLLSQTISESGNDILTCGEMCALAGQKVANHVFGLTVTNGVVFAPQYCAIACRARFNTSARQPDVGGGTSDYRKHDAGLESTSRARRIGLNTRPSTGQGLQPQRTRYGSLHSMFNIVVVTSSEGVVVPDQLDTPSHYPEQLSLHPT